MRATKRIENELKKLNEVQCDLGLRVEVFGPLEWRVGITGAIGTLYEGEEFTLKIKFSSDYPIESPQVVFMTPAPVHEHVYSNGHICLNILGDDWSPALTVHAICLSILSMLSSATEKCLPPDNERYVRANGFNSNPKETTFVYHDDTV